MIVDYLVQKIGFKRKSPFIVTIIIWQLKNLMDMVSSVLVR